MKKRAEHAMHPRHIPRSSSPVCMTERCGDEPETWLGLPWCAREEWNRQWSIRVQTFKVGAVRENVILN